MMHKYRLLGTYNAEWHTKGRRPVISLAVFYDVVRSFYINRGRAINEEDVKKF